MFHTPNILFIVSLDAMGKENIYRKVSVKPRMNQTQSESFLKGSRGMSLSLFENFVHLKIFMSAAESIFHGTHKLIRMVGNAFDVSLAAPESDFVWLLFVSYSFSVLMSKAGKIAFIVCYNSELFYF